MSANNIILIGFMGSGKSSVGRVLAKERETYFLDTDAMIESSEGKSIPAIFEEEGETYFRMLEKNTARWLKENINKAVISTGGGMMIHCDELKELGKVVYLQVPFETILKRMDIKELEKRPLFKDKGQAKKMYEQRDAIYRRYADIIIDADTELDNVISQVRAQLS